jgi:hypothetical protein
MNNNAQGNEAHSLLSQVALLLDEARALSYAVVMALAHTPREELSREEIDGLCQLAYELQNKLARRYSKKRSKSCDSRNPQRVRPWRRSDQVGACRQSTGQAATSLA